MPVSGDDNPNHIVGNDGDPGFADDEIFGLGGDDLLEGLGGDDRLYGGNDNDTLIGGNDHDELYGGDGDDVLNGAGGDHTTFVQHPGHQPNPTEVLDGGIGNDTMVMHYAGYALVDHPEKVLAFHVDITLGNGEAEITFGRHNAVEKGEAFNSIEALDFVGPEGSDEVTGGALRDTINGNGGDDILRGAGGNDDIGDTSGFIDADGGDGTDIFRLTRTDSRAVIVDANAGSVTVNGASAGQFTNFENLEVVVGNAANNVLTGFLHGLNIFITSTGNDTLTGGKLADTLIGGGGNDTINGDDGDDAIDTNNGAGNDVIHAGAGNDTIGSFGNGGGRDQVFGERGDDNVYVDVAHHVNGSTYDGGNGNDSFHAGEPFSATAIDFSHDTITGFETLDEGVGSFASPLTAKFTSAQFSQFSTILYLHSNVVLADNGTVVLPSVAKMDVLQMANGGQTVDCTAVTFNVAPFIKGGTGNDTVIGSAVITIAAALGKGNDTYTGHAGGSFISGEDGNDTLTGGAGADVLNGGADADTLTGGGGLDKFVYLAVSDSTGPNFDTVSHFDFDAEDKFDLPFAVADIDHKVTVGALSTATFNTDLKAAITHHELKAGHAVLFTPDSGDEAGKTFLIVDANAHAGYQSGADVVILLDSATHIGALDTADFI